MTPEVAAQLRALNRRFYAALADPFAETRATPQPGFARLVAYLPQREAGLRVVDVGCGEGRFGRFLQSKTAVAHYTGIDFTPDLLHKAKAGLDASISTDFLVRDLGLAGCLKGLGRFDLVVCLATLQHIPGRANRLRLLQEMQDHLAPEGRLFLSNWQFLDSPRQHRKLRDWPEIGLAPVDVEPHDYLLTWRRGGFGLRYVCLIDAVETAVLAQQAGLCVVSQFRSDGKEGNLNLYTVLGPAA